MLGSLTNIHSTGGLLLGFSHRRGLTLQLGYEGVAAYQKGDYVSARDKLERAYRVVRAPSLGLWSARALEKSGKLVEASERYLEVTRLEVKAGEAAVQQELAQPHRQLIKQSSNLWKAGASPHRVGLKITAAVDLDLQGVDGSAGRSGA